MPDRDLDLVLYGATGFTGRLVARHLRERTRDGDLRWGIAGRDAGRLRAVADELDLPDLPVITADADDPEALRSLAGSTAVVCTTVGPYATYGSGLVAACADAGTDYCDLTGEVHWMRRMIDAHLPAAEASGARIVHTCGFDSIPSDLGTWWAQQQLHARDGVHATRVSTRIKAARGGVSGGTLASMTGVMAAAGEDPAVRRIMADPYALNPEGERVGPPVTSTTRPRYDADFDAWVGPFVMELINSRVVRRTNALLGWPWGREFRYDEAVLLGPGPAGALKAGALAGGMGAGMAAMAVGPLRDLVGRVLPDPGEGPSPEAQEAGFFDIRVLAVHPTDRSRDLVVRVRGDRDPGYGSTAKMLGESALALAAGEAAVGGGFWTPASALGQALVDRLQVHAGVTFDVVSDGPGAPGASARPA